MPAFSYNPQAKIDIPSAPEEELREHSPKGWRSKIHWFLNTTFILICTVTVQCIDAALTVYGFLQYTTIFYDKAATALFTTSKEYVHHCSTFFGVFSLARIILVLLSDWRGQSKMFIFDAIISILSFITDVLGYLVKDESVWLPYLNAACFLLAIIRLALALYGLIEAMVENRLRKAEERYATDMSELRKEMTTEMREFKKDMMTSNDKIRDHQVATDHRFSTEVKRLPRGIISRVAPQPSLRREDSSRLRARRNFAAFAEQYQSTLRREESSSVRARRDYAAYRQKYGLPSSPSPSRRLSQVLFPVLATE